MDPVSVRLPRTFNTRLLYDRLENALNGRTIGVRGHLPKPFHEALLIGLVVAPLTWPLPFQPDFRPRGIRYNFSTQE